jgi:hypothetical protein
MTNNMGSKFYVTYYWSMRALYKWPKAQAIPFFDSAIEIAGVVLTKELDPFIDLILQVMKREYFSENKT